MGWFWKKRKERLDSEEYLELKRLIFNLEIEVEQLQSRFKKKIKPNKEEDLKDSDSKKKGGLIRPSDYKKYGIDR